MSMTYSAFKDAVLLAYNPGAQGSARENAAIEAVALLVKSQIVREVDSDLPLAKSFRDAYLAAKVKLAGYTITSNFATVKAAVIVRLTIDGARAGISEVSGYNDVNIQQAIDDFNGGAVMFDQLLAAAALDLQRHVPCFQSNQENSYDIDSTEITNEGFVSKLTLPSQAVVKRLWHGYVYEALVANTAYAVDDYVLSNGRVYQCTVAGTSANPLGDGLLSTDGLAEVSGTASFVYLRPLDYLIATPVAWADRQAMFQNEACVNLVYAIKPTGDELWFYPALRQEYGLKLEWSGLKTTFAGGDSTSFDEPAAQYAAEYIRGMLQKNVAEDSKAAAGSLAVASDRLKRLWIDCYSRT